MVFCSTKDEKSLTHQEEELQRKITDITQAGKLQLNITVT